MKNFIQKFFLLTIIVLATNVAKAQTGYDFAQYDLGIGLDLNKAYTDAQTIVGTKSGRFTFNYNVSPFVNYIVEVQTGTLRGGDSLLTTTGREFTNSFTAVMLRGQLQMGEIMDYSESKMANAFKNLYLSSGIGMIYNHMTKINRASIQYPGFYTNGDNNSSEIVIPLRIGYEFKVFNQYTQPGFKIDIGFQNNFILGDDLDGFVAGKQKDSYSQVSIGLKFAIGGVVTYRKQIPY